MFSDKFKTHKYGVDRAYICLILNMLVHHVSSKHKKVNTYFWELGTYYSKQMGVVTAEIMDVGRVITSTLRHEMSNYVI